MSYEINVFADERKIAANILCSSLNFVCDVINTWKKRYEEKGDFDSIQIITYNSDAVKVDEEWINM